MRGRSIGAAVDIFIGFRSDQLRVRNVRNIQCHPTGSETKERGKTKSQTKAFLCLLDVLKSTRQFLVLLFY